MTLDWLHIRRLLWQWFIGMLLVATWFMLADLTCTTQGGCSDAVAGNLNLVGSSAIIVICLRTTFALMRANTLLLFTPLVAYSAAGALFYGFGPMSNYLASEATQQFLANAVYLASPNAMLVTNLLSSVGIAISILGALAVLPKAPQQVAPRPIVSLKTVTVVFLVTGLALKHLVIMPSIYGTSSFFLPGMVRNLRYLPDLGFALAAMIAASGDRKWTLIFWLIWPWHLMLAFPEFSKKSVMLTILLPALGAYVGHRSFRRFIPWLVAAMLIFSVLQNVNAVSRWAEHRAEEYHEVLNVRQRLALLANTTFSDVDIESYLPVAKLGVETWWLRLNFSGSQAAAMELYDSGISSTFTQNILVYLVPRILWPDKPSIVSPGRQFHATVIGNDDTRTKVGITVFADGYWKLGWFGVVLFSAFLGLVFGLVTRMNVTQLARRQFLYLPTAMMGLQMGATSTTAFLQNAIISGLPTYFAFTLVVFVTYRILHGIGRAQQREAGMIPRRHSPSRPTLTTTGA